MHVRLAACLAAACLTTSAQAGAPAPGPQLLELFTSQGCSSCPPAEKFFADLAEDPSLVTVEWHVDYWDRLIDGGTSWKDPFSSAENTDRQRAYNRALRGTGAVYTPQAVFAGSTEFVGSRKDDLAKARKKAIRPIAQLSAREGEVEVSGVGAGEVVFVRLLRSQATDVKGGENRGHRLAGRHIALERRVLGDWAGDREIYPIPALEDGETCAIFIQGDRNTPGPVLGATYCKG